MKLKEYIGYENWEELLNKYKNEDFGDAEVRKHFRDDFNEVSELMWRCWTKNFDDMDIKALAEVWCSGIEQGKTMKDTYEEACAYLDYSSDRMNFGRWMRIRILLNYDVK